MSQEDAKIDRAISSVVSNIKMIRESKGISMNRLAWMSGVSVKGIDFIEKGQNSPTLRTLLKICRALEINLSEQLAEAEKSSDL